MHIAVQHRSLQNIENCHQSTKFLHAAFPVSICPYLFYNFIEMYYLCEASFTPPKGTYVGGNWQTIGPTRNPVFIKRQGTTFSTK